MLSELHIENLGLIEQLTIELHPGLTAVTGETGAGKTMLVEAIAVLLGGRADASMIRHQADEARIEGRFQLSDREHVVARVIPQGGRSRAYLDGRLVTAATLAELTGSWVELHGQHSHQQLISAPDQRAALDRWAASDLEPVRQARSAVNVLNDDLAKLGGDDRQRQREIDLLTYQHDELHAARLDDPDEDRRLQQEEELLAGSEALRSVALGGAEMIGADDGPIDALRAVIADLGHHGALSEIAARVRAVVAELDDVAGELRHRGEMAADDPQRREIIRSRRQLLSELRRKYGDDLVAVIAYRQQVDADLANLLSADERRLDLLRQLRRAEDDLRRAEAVLGEQRRQAAPGLASQIGRHLRRLALPHASVEIQVGSTDPGDEVEMLFSANPGAPLLPLSKVASGGELARAMLAVRLVLSAEPPTMVFDEVDAGIGGEAAATVAQALAELAVNRQVLVVTHLAQVAAAADDQLLVSKKISKRNGVAATTASAQRVTGDGRVSEIARLISGRTHSSSARAHAVELLASRR